MKGGLKWKTQSRVIKVQKKTLAKCSGLWYGQRFCGYDPKNMNKKSEHRQMDYIKLVSSCTVKEMIRLKRQPAEWDKIFANYSSDKRLIFTICKDLKQHQKIRFKNGQVIWIAISQKKISNGQQIYGEMLRITNPQRNMNRKVNEMSV